MIKKKSEVEKAEWNRSLYGNAMYRHFKSGNLDRADACMKLYSDSIMRYVLYKHCK
jgi:hypothetical protein